MTDIAESVSLVTRNAWQRDAFSMNHTTLKNFPWTRAFSLDRWINKTQLIDLLSWSSCQPHSDLNCRQKNPLQVSNCFSELGLGWFKVMHFSSSLWKCQFDGFEVLQQFPKCIEAKLWMSAKCVNVLWQLTVLSVCLWVCEWSLRPLGVKTEQISVDTGC